MLLEVAGFWGVIIVLLFLYSEISGIKAISIVPAVMLLVLGYWILSDVTGIEVRTGVDVSMNSYLDNVTNHTVTIQNTTYLYTKAVVPLLGGFTLEGMIGLFCEILGLGLILTHSFGGVKL
jgi:hypothetical protein